MDRARLYVERARPTVLTGSVFLAIRKSLINALKRASFGVERLLYQLRPSCAGDADVAAALGGELWLGELVSPAVCGADMDRCALSARCLKAGSVEIAGST